MMRLMMMTIEKYIKEQLHDRGLLWYTAVSPLENLKRLIESFEEMSDSVEVDIRSEGFDDGKQEGYKEGYKEGYDNAISEARYNLLLMKEKNANQD